MGLISCSADGSDLGVDVRNLPEAHHDANLKRKRKSKKDGEGNSNPPPYLSNKIKKSKTTRRSMRFTYTEVAEVQKRVVIKAARVVKAVKDTKVAKVDNFATASKASEAPVVEIAMNVEESSHQTKEVEQEFAKVSTHQNPCKLSNVEISIISESIIIDTSSFFVPITTSTNINESPTTNVLETKNTLETIEPEYTITTKQTQQNTMQQQPTSPSKSQSSPQ